MAKLPFFQFYPLDWLRDTGQLSPKAKAAWIDLLSYAWNEPERGVFSRSKEAFCNLLRIDPADLLPVLTELGYVSVVILSDKIVTIKSKRMMKFDSARNNHAKHQRDYVKRLRNDMKVMPQTLDVRSQTLDVIKELTTTPIKISAKADGGISKKLTPPKTEGPNALVVAHYKQAQGVQADDKDWDRKFWARSAKAASEILDAIGSPDAAISFFDYHVKEFRDKGLSWTLETIARRAVLWKAQRKGIYGHTRHAGISKTLPLKRTGGESQGLRAPTEIATLLTSIRGPEDSQCSPF